MAALGFWLLGLLAWPLLFWQARRARSNTPRLPEAPGIRRGAAGRHGPRRRIRFLGDSPIAGVGVRRYADSLPARLVHGLAERGRCRLAWSVQAATGARLRDHVPPPHEAASPPETLVLSFGVNDVTGMTSVRAWRRQLQGLLDARVGGMLVVLGVPPMAAFSALPWPLNRWLGWRARMLDASTAELLSERTDALFVPVPPIRDPRLLAADGFHPSALGAERWAEAILAVIPDAKWWAVLDSNQRPAD